MPLSANDLTRTRRFLDDKGSSEEQVLTISNATGGTFTLNYSGQTTGAIAYNATPGVIQNALTGLSNVGVGNIVVRSENAQNTSPFNIFFQGTLDNIAIPVITADGSLLTGTSPTAIVIEVTAGGQTAFTDAELSDSYDQANGNFFLGIYYSILELTTSSTKFNDYAIGQTSEKKSQIWDHLHEMLADYLQRANADRQVGIAGMHPVPNRKQPRPYQPGSVNSTNNSWTPTSRNGWNDGGDW